MRVPPSTCRALLVVACFVAIASASATVRAAPGSVGIATWNVNWLLDADTHARWIRSCSRYGWPAPGLTLAPAAIAELANLPYCNVHNGMRFPPDDCVSTADNWPDATRYPPVHACRETADLAAWADYERKRAALRTVFARLADAGVQVIALQEVASAAAVAPLLPTGWKVATTQEQHLAPRIAQHVGVAWAAGAGVRALAVVPELAASGVAQRPLRPGLAFTLPVGGRPVRVLVVHLKAGCRNRSIDAPLTERDARLPAARQDQIASDCAMLRYQVPALESWVDAQAAADFAVVGDFNRTLLREPVQDTPGRPTRLDQTAATAAVGPCTMEREGQRLVARCPARIAALFPELNDGAPRGATLWRARTARGDGPTGRCSIAGAKGNLAHEGIDHILISASLKRRLTAQALTLQVMNFADAEGNPLKATPTMALPSDHCPHYVTWTPEPR